MTHYKRLSSFALVAIALLMVAVAASIGLMGHIDVKLDVYKRQFRGFALVPAFAPDVATVPKRGTKGTRLQATKTPGL